MIWNALTRLFFGRNLGHIERFSGNCCVTLQKFILRFKFDLFRFFRSSVRERLFLLDGLRGLGQTFDFESLGRLEEGRKLVLGNVHLSGVHELENSGQMLKSKIDSKFKLRFVNNLRNVCYGFANSSLHSLPYYWLMQYRRKFVCLFQGQSHQTLFFLIFLFWL